ncbi:2,3-diaminopropionate biosynthesis protein SbnB [Tsukamurella pulmonis]|nr:2,3-diaminopropionate biosynthesis protein SbnB [Tsukamurella pulmonis]
MLAINRTDVDEIVAERHIAIIDAVEAAYRSHERYPEGTPHSVFLRFPDDPVNRIIGLPAYVGNGGRPTAGLKWISSFPANTDRGRERASAVIVLNDLETGYPRAILEGARISALRTAASAAAFSRIADGARRVEKVGVIGCGTINLATIAMLRAVHPALRTVAAHDAVPERAAQFVEATGLDGAVAPTIADVVDADVLAIATTDSSYWLDLDGALHDRTRPGRITVLHTSLRDIAPASLVGALNAVDDVEHALRADTALERAVRLASADGRTAADVVPLTIGALAAGTAHIPADDGRPLVYSPFGLGITDIAVARWVADEAERTGRGVRLEGFEPGVHATAAAHV